ncbi:MAG: hypothetical protein ACXW1P_09115 [Methylophilaceae bacterium]
MVTHYLKSYVIIDADGKERFMVAVFRKARLGWQAVTTFHSNRESYFEKMRRGFLAFQKK